jgi:3',5'-cyclic-AMP phosphodiesterase
VIYDAELFSVADDGVVVTFRTDDVRAVTTIVGGREVVTEGMYHHVRVEGLEPATQYDLRVDGTEASDLLPARLTTLDRPSGRRLATIATANDVHFGESECGRLGDGDQLGPIFSAEPGEDPYPEIMNRSVIDDIEGLGPDAVVVKGDLTDTGSEEQYEMFLTAYGQLGSLLHHVRGNHDAMITETIASEHAPFAIELDGVTLAVLDTVRPGSDKGRITADQLEWLDSMCAETVQPVLVFGHHHPWDPSDHERNDHYFGINPDDSEALCELVDRRESIAGYFAGHTHRNRVRRFARARNVPMVEVACVKDYPGAWAEYRIYEGGYTQIVRRASSPAALAWTEKTRQMFAGLYRDYALGRLDDRCFTQPF